MSEPAQALDPEPRRWRRRLAIAASAVAL